MGARKPLKWPKDHVTLMQKHQLSLEDIEPGRHKFIAAVEHVKMTQRQQECLWLNIASLQKRRRILDWTKEFLVANIGASASRMSVRQNIVPCIEPSMQYIILDHGQAECLNAESCMALQGVQKKEAAAFNLHAEPSTHLKDLAGNAFTANILCAYLIAWLLST